MENVIHKLEEHDAQLELIAGTVATHTQKFDTLTAQVQDNSKKIDGNTKRLDTLDNKVDRLASRVIALEEKTDDMLERMATKDDIASINGRLDELLVIAKRGDEERIVHAHQIRTLHDRADQHDTDIAQLKTATGLS